VQEQSELLGLGGDFTYDLLFACESDFRGGLALYTQYPASFVVCAPVKEKKIHDMAWLEQCRLAAS